MSTFVSLSPAGEPASRTDRLRLAAAAYLARFTGPSRSHTESDLRIFLAWCAERRLDPLAAGRAQVELYVRWMQEIRRLKPSTVSRRMSVVADFYRTCVIDGILEHSPAEHVRRPPVPAECPTLGLTHLQLEALLAAARDSANPFDFALVCLLGLLGLRIFEACGANIEDLGEEHGHRVLTVRGKGGKIVLVPLPPAVARAIDRAAGGRVAGPLLLNRYGTRMDRQAATRRLAALARACRMRMPALHPHMLRHTFVTTIRRRRRPPGRANRRPARRPTHHHALRPGPQPARPAPQLHPRRLHGLRQLTRPAQARSAGLETRLSPTLAEVRLVDLGTRSWRCVRA
jgi:integrase/recombinase XerD